MRPFSHHFEEFEYWLWLHSSLGVQDGVPQVTHHAHLLLLFARLMHGRANG
jgi:hypothetical protein